MRDVATEVGSQLMKNNDRNNQQEDMLKVPGEAIMGLRGEFQENRTGNQKLHENQKIMERKMEERG